MAQPPDTETGPESPPADGPGIKARLIRGGLGAGGLRVGAVVLTLLLSVLLARELGPAAFGQYSFVTALLAVLSIPIGAAMQQLVTRETASIHQAGDWERLASLWRWAKRRVIVLAGAVVFGIVVLTALFADWSGADRWTLVLASAAALPFIGMTAVTSGALAGLGRVVVAQLAEQAVRPTVQLAACIALLAVGSLSALTALLAFAVASLLGYFVARTLLVRARPEPAGVATVTSDPNWHRSWLPFTLLIAASTLNAQIGILVLGWLGTDEAIGAMRIAERGAQLVALSLAIVNMVLGPYVTHAWKQRDTRRLQALWSRSAQLALLVALVPALLLTVTGGYVIDFAFGAEYVASARAPLAIMSVGQLVNVAFGSVGLMLSMSGFERDTLVGQVVALAVNLLAAFVLVPGLQATGAAIAATSGLLVWNVILAVQVWRRLGVRPIVLR